VIALLLALLLGGPAAAQERAVPQEAPAVQESWLQRDTAVLQTLDKVNARTATLTVQVGKPVQYGTLTITLRACRIRSEEQATDAMAWLEVVDSRANPGTPPVFQGWMFATAPSVSMLQHPVYDVRVMRCK